MGDYFLYPTANKVHFVTKLHRVLKPYWGDHRAISHGLSLCCQNLLQGNESANKRTDVQPCIKHMP